MNSTPTASMLRICSFAILTVFAASSHARGEANAIYEALVGPGVKVSATDTLTLPKPLLPDELPADQVRPAIESVVGEKYDWDTFSRKSIVSPFLLKISEGTAESGPVTRRVDIYFIAHGSLDVLKQEDYLSKQLNLAGNSDQTDSSGKAKILTADDLRKRKIEAITKPAAPRWIAVNSKLLGKVLINLTTQNIKSEGKDSILIASIADPRFKGDAEFPNSWQSLTTDDTGKRQVGPAEPYAGLASYAKATRIADPPGAIFMEYHVVFIEPQGWFNGTNLLRSKLPIVAQEMVRRFRRNLGE